LNAAVGSDVCDGRLRAVTPFPWDVVMHVGLCLLRLPAKDFWTLTPVEFFLMTSGARPRAPATDRAELDELMRAFPDQA